MSTEDGFKMKILVLFEMFGFRLFHCAKLSWLFRKKEFGRVLEKTTSMAKDEMDGEKIS